MSEIHIGSFLSNRYEILEKIGSGGMAEVYRARCHLLNRFVAIKALKNEFSEDEEFLHRFEVEAQAAASITHPNIVSVYDVGFDKGTHYIVMELAEGITLKEYINKNGALEWREAAGIAAQICSALECAHKKGIIHRDIKPHNIIITKTGVAKVTDFGIARAPSAATTVADNSVVGSAHYLSPEQARGGYTDEKSDIYSAGVTLYEMLTGRVPFNADSAVSVAMMHMSDTPVEPRIINPKIPEDMEKIVLKAMSKEQSGRYQSAGEMLSDIDAVLSNKKPALKDSSDDTRIASGAEMHRRRAGAQEKKNGNAKKQKKALTSGEKRLVAAAVIAAIVFILVAGVAIFSMFGGLGFGQLDETIVPDIEGMTKDEAQKALKDAKLKMDIEEEIASLQYEKDTIISQDPSAGRSLKKGAKVMVKISTGADGNVLVPNVVNYEVDNAISTLEKAGFKVSVIEENDDSVQKGNIIRQSPSAGSEADMGDTVRIYVSGGVAKSEISVPNVIGKSLAQAKNALESVGLTVGNVAEVESESAVGTVVGQSPKSGAKIEKGGAVALNVSKGESSITPEPTSDTQPTSEPDKVKTITLPVPQNKDSTRIVVVANGKTIHDSTHNKSEVSFDIRVSGKSSANLEIYHDGTLVGTQTITF